jgi:hypothetical protein
VIVEEDWLLAVIGEAPSLEKRWLVVVVDAHVLLLVVVGAGTWHTASSIQACGQIIFFCVQVRSRICQKRRSTQACSWASQSQVLLDADAEALELAMLTGE